MNSKCYDLLSQIIKKPIKDLSIGVSYSKINDEEAGVFFKSLTGLKKDKFYFGMARCSNLTDKVVPDMESFLKNLDCKDFKLNVFNIEKITKEKQQQIRSSLLDNKSIIKAKLNFSQIKC